MSYKLRGNWHYLVETLAEESVQDGGTLGTKFDLFRVEVTTRKTGQASGFNQGREEVNQFGRLIRFELGNRPLPERSPVPTVFHGRDRPEAVQCSVVGVKEDPRGPCGRLEVGEFPPLSALAQAEAVVPEEGDDGVVAVTAVDQFPDYATSNREGKKC